MLNISTHSSTFMNGLMFNAGEWENISISLVPTEAIFWAGSGDDNTFNTTVTVQINDVMMDQFTVDINMPSQLDNVTIGDSFVGFIQDIGIKAQQCDSLSASAAKAAFLPQCLCPQDYILSPDELGLTCTMGSDTLAR